LIRNLTSSTLLLSIIVLKANIIFLIRALLYKDWPLREMLQNMNQKKRKNKNLHRGNPGDQRVHRVISKESISPPFEGGVPDQTAPNQVLEPILVRWGG
jgi:hypothetical protein